MSTIHEKPEARERRYCLQGLPSIVWSGEDQAAYGF